MSNERSRDEKALDGPKVAAIAEAARQTLGCRAVVIVAIGEGNARTVVANPTMPIADALACAAGSIYIAQGQYGVRVGPPEPGEPDA